MSEGRDDERFEDLVGDVKPMADRNREHAPARKVPPRRAPVETAQRGPRLLQDTGPGSGRAADAARSLVAGLQRGEPPVERQVDLHGQRREVARRSLFHHLDAALQAGQRCVLVIHGAGQHSPDGPVLREALPGWLAAWPQVDRLLAYAPAPDRLGGKGATLVLLRRAARQGGTP